MSQHIKIKNNKADTYTSPSKKPGLFSRLLPSLSFYLMATSVIFKGSRIATKGKYDMRQWVEDSQSIADAAEAVGGRILIEGLDNLRSLNGPCVIISNHMSTLETFLLPSIFQPIKDVTFIVKKALMEYPIFKHIMRASRPITVGRVNPREDLKAVMEDGQRVLSEGRSIIVFPQTTRTEKFDPAQFNTIGVKLAARAGVPVLPVALYTAFWSNGRLLKDYGYIHPERTIRFTIGKPITIEGKGTKEHQAIVDFIKSRLDSWTSPE